MQRTFCLAVLFAMFLFATESLAQKTATEAGPKPTSLCGLQEKVAQGNHETVLVSGTYGPGLDRTVLEEPSCPNEGTWVELALRSQENKEKLRKLLDRSRQAYVVVEGEFYGPPLPDPKLPEAIKKGYRPGWGHLSAFKTKLVVHVIRDVKPAPAPAPGRETGDRRDVFWYFDSDSVSRSPHWGYVPSVPFVPSLPSEVRRWYPPIVYAAKKRRIRRIECATRQLQQPTPIDPTKFTPTPKPPSG